MAISRCSVDGAKCFLNCNPESPYHYLYQNYIDNDELLESGDVGVWHFTLEDNPNLPPEYIDELKRVNRKSQVFYKRNILGEWVVAEGAVYPTFDESENVFYGEVSCDDYDAVNICCDYGVSTVTTFGVMGIKYNEPNEYYLLEETYYDAEETGIQQSDSERVEDILKLQDKYGLNIHNTIFLPHDAASLKVACEKDDRIRMNIETYMPDTYGDIEVIQDLITNRKLKIHESCTNTIRQIQTYSYDLKAQRKGEDRVVKENDHCPDMIRGGILGPRKRKSAVIGYVNI
jgi:PBSX family phage terminase large subunit